MDTIFALASARGKAGVSVIRISGNRAEEAATQLCGSLPEARKAALRRLTWQGEVLDEALVLRFAKEKSFTGEATVEFQVHGGVATVQAVLAALGRQPGLRMAEPGEFTRRALENGKLDLTQVEGLADIIDAETESQRRQALRVMSGQLGAKVEAWRRNLIRAAALIEASIDFADEDVPVDVVPEVKALLEDLRQALSVELAGSQAAERIRSGFEVAIVGEPNLGKSTLLNALAGREAAITSEVAGTTRDVIEVHMDIAGYAVTLLDTAGLRETSDPVERIGVQRAMERAAAADLRVFLVAERGAALPIAAQAGDLVLLAKADLTGEVEDSISGLTGVGVDRLLADIGQRLATRVAGAGLVVRARHRVAVERALAGLERSIRMLASARGLELVASELRGCAVTLGSLVGRIDVETLLDEIFSSFCIGK